MENPRRDPAGRPVWLGVDLGTQSVRVLAADASGRVVRRASAPLTGRREAERHEQDPAAWWAAVRDAAREALRDVPPGLVQGVAVCSTSGTVLLADDDGRPLTPGLMYDDGRARAEAAEAQEAGAELWERLGRRIQPSWALPKALWLTRARPGARLLHQADFVNERLVGERVATDSSHALKTGYDLLGERWPGEVFDALGLDATLLPEVVRPGTVLGKVSPSASEETGIPAGTPVVAGMTDGCASQIGSGALRVGHWNSVLGTTLVLKGVTSTLVRDPLGVLYSHRSPDGTWLPGGASSVGAGALTTDGDLADLDERATRWEPSSAVAYPLVSSGERFPFLAPDAVPFVLGTPADDADRHAALLQGVAFIERLALAYVRRLGAPVDGPLTFTGGAVRSAYWTQLRADVLGRPARVPEHADAALGMAILAAYGTTGAASLADVAEPMVRIRTVVEPRPGVRDRFTAPYHRLLDELERRGWLPADVASHAREEG
ncbi:FGGY-family carbohydrate kinase [Actinomadura miaoliensis]|uniref:FGGY-family carbohydrate kinase n=1 Tax=Actinomadura miaoliensis TaxID=430685 RepID=A0ABP7X1V5_9ACTN